MICAAEDVETPKLRKSPSPSRRCSTWPSSCWRFSSSRFKPHRSKRMSISICLPSPPPCPAIPRGARKSEASKSADSDLESTLLVRAVADELGRLKSLSLGDAPLTGASELRKRLTHYRELLESRPLRVLLIADDALRYEDAARIVAATSAAGATSIRLADPAAPPKRADAPKEARP